MVIHVLSILGPAMLALVVTGALMYSPLPEPSPPLATLPLSVERALLDVIHGSDYSLVDSLHGPTIMYFGHNTSIGSFDMYYDYPMGVAIRLDPVDQFKSDMGISLRNSEVPEQTSSDPQ